jgi:hypothetical protein
MSHPEHLLQAIAEQRQAELIAAAERYRLARRARAARVRAGTRGAEPDRPQGRGRRPVRELMGRFRHWDAFDPRTQVQR